MFTIGSRLFVATLNSSETADTAIKVSNIMNASVMVPLLTALMCISIMIILIVTEWQCTRTVLFRNKVHHFQQEHIMATIRINKKQRIKL